MIIQLIENVNIMIKYLFSTRFTFKAAGKKTSSVIIEHYTNIILQESFRI